MQMKTNRPFPGFEHSVLFTSIYLRILCTIMSLAKENNTDDDNNNAYHGTDGNVQLRVLPTLLFPHSLRLCQSEVKVRP